MRASPLERSSSGREAPAEGAAAAPGDSESGLQQPDPDPTEAERLPAGAHHRTADPDRKAAGSGTLSGSCKAKQGAPGAGWLLRGLL